MRRGNARVIPNAGRTTGNLNDPASGLLLFQLSTVTPGRSSTSIVPVREMTSDAT